MVSSNPRKAEICASSCLCSSCVPQMKRTETCRSRSDPAPASRFTNFLIVGEAEIVVGAEVEHPRAAGDLDLGRLHRGDDAFGLIKAGGFSSASSCDK
ncbi:hypothetical protein NIG5292_02766 [Nereida ignava]|uniref:Uncharacterized protein n=1 Tax=Nereida ignava TaxID=282199 RepID=A0A0U1NPM8_9RHOB|nr:hypothetical protein NIG5292_02766 [Nereida ignava]SFJ91852.1 hypothetical protein SAMN02745667_02763 [Nereida ignava DSM 16309]